MSGMRLAVLRGFFRLARFQPDGFACFAATRQALLQSLVPLLAFPLIGGGLLLLDGNLAAALSNMFSAVILLLTPLLIAHALAARWGREAAWLRYAVAFNWCQLALPLAAVVLLLALGMLMRATGISQEVAALGFLAGLLVYALGLHWFLARHGLGLSAGQAVLCVLAGNLGTGLLVLAPRLLAAP